MDELKITYGPRPYFSRVLIYSSLSVVGCSKRVTRCRFFFGWEGMLPAELIASVGVSGPSGGWLGISFLSGM